MTKCAAFKRFIPAEQFHYFDEMKNSVDPDQLALKPADLDLHHLKKKGHRIFNN